MKAEVIRLLERAREALLLEEPHVHSQLIGEMKLMIDKLRSLRDVDPLAPVSEQKESPDAS